MQTTCFDEVIFVFLFALFLNRLFCGESWKRLEILLISDFTNLQEPTGFRYQPVFERQSREASRQLNILRQHLHSPCYMCNILSHQTLSIVLPFKGRMESFLCQSAGRWVQKHSASLERKHPGHGIGDGSCQTRQK